MDSLYSAPLSCQIVGVQQSRRSFSELAFFVEEVREKAIDLHCRKQPISTVESDDWMDGLLLNLMIVFADVEWRMIADRVQQGTDKARRGGKRVGRPPFGYNVKDGFMHIKPTEYARAQNFIQDVKKGQSKTKTAEFLEISASAIRSILKRAEQNYEIPFENGEWKVEAGEKELTSLDGASNRTPRRPRSDETHLAAPHVPSMSDDEETIDITEGTLQ